MLQQFINALVLGSIFALFALGLTLAWGALDVLNLAHGALFVLAAFVAYELTRVADLPFVVLIVLGMVGAGLVAVGLEVSAFRPIRRRYKIKRQAELSLLLASIGASIILDRVIANATDDQVFTAGDAAFTSHRFDLGLFSVSDLQIIIVVVALMVGVVLDTWIGRSRHGRAVRSIAFDPDVARLMGVDVDRLSAATIFVSGALAGLAGVMVSIYSSGIDVTVGQAYLIKGFAVLIVGGVGSVRGAVLAAYLVALAETMIVAYGPGGFRDGVAFVLIILVLLVRPQGLFARSRFERA